MRKVWLDLRQVTEMSFLSLFFLKTVGSVVNLLNCRGLKYFNIKRLILQAVLEIKQGLIEGRLDRIRGFGHFLLAGRDYGKREKEKWKGQMK